MDCLAPIRKASLIKHGVRDSTLTAVAIFDGFFNGVSAMKALACLNESLGPGPEINRLSWSFDNLQRLDVRHMSEHQAAQADLVIIAANGDIPLPDHVKSWLESIRHEQTQPFAALIVLHSEDNASSLLPAALACQVKHLARRWQCEFLCNDEFYERLIDGFAEQIIQRHIQAELADQGFTTHWGINE